MIRCDEDLHSLPSICSRDDDGGKGEKPHDRAENCDFGETVVLNFFIQTYPAPRLFVARI